MQVVFLTSLGAPSKISEHSFSLLQLLAMREDSPKHGGTLIARVPVKLCNGHCTSSKDEANTNVWQTMREG